MPFVQEVIDKRCGTVNSMLSGNYGDNINNEADKNKKNDPEMIQDGIAAYWEATKKK